MRQAVRTVWAALRGAGLAVVLMLAASGAFAQVVAIDGPSGVRLNGHWFAAPGQPTARPVVLALHGCGGLYDGKRRLASRYTDYAAWLNQRGVHALMLDSFGSRGLGSQCSTRHRDRRVQVDVRRQDVIAALQWLSAQPGVDARRMALLGWSNGATTALNVIDLARGEPPALAGVAVFYPGCGPLLRQSATLAPRVPLLMQLGGADDWTPPEPCQRLAELQRARGHTDVTLRTYAGAYHGFDSTAPMRFRADVPNGVDRAGVHQGGDAQAREQSLAALDAFLTRVLSLRGAL